MCYPLQAADKQGCVETSASKHPVFTVYFIRTHSYFRITHDFIISKFPNLSDDCLQKLCI